MLVLHNMFHFKMITRREVTYQYRWKKCQDKYKRKVNEFMEEMENSKTVYEKRKEINKK